MIKVLLDAAFPAGLDRFPNAEGIEFHRVVEGLSDAGLLQLAVDGGYQAVAFLEPEMVSRADFRERAGREGVTLICSVTDDPLEAEANLRHALESISEAVASSPATVLWLRRSGLRADLDD